MQAATRNTFALLLMGLTAQPSLGRTTGRKLWAYPDGVLVTTDLGKIMVTQDEPKDDEFDSQVGEAQSALRTFARELEASAKHCFDQLRWSTPGLQATGAKYTFAVEWQLPPKGPPTDVQLLKRGASADLPSCLKDLTVKVAAANNSSKLRPIANGRPHTERVEMEALIMDDETAKGRGYHYLEAEETWNDALAANSRWFTCSKNTDCVAVTDQCERRAISQQWLPAYQAAIKGRQKPGCIKPEDPSTLTARCEQRRCTVR